MSAKAGIPGELVLIDTRDNGSKDMLLPSMMFNHCIVLTHIDGKEYYVELTDSNLPFTSLPSNLMGALSLIIPPHGQKGKSEIRPLNAIHRTTEQSIKDISVVISGKDEKLTVEAKLFGNLTSGWRSSYGSISAEKQIEDFEQYVGNSYKNPVKMEKLRFKGLEELGDSIVCSYTYSIKNEVIEAGSMRMIKIPFLDVIASLENFSLDKREFPIEYWNYENTDKYETSITVQLPPGQKFLEIPSNVDLVLKNNTYSIKYIKMGQTLKVIRSAKLQRQNIDPADYESFKKFFNDIVEAESKYLVFK